jgi:hypothetical protein
MHLLAQLLKPFADPIFCSIGVGIHAAPQPICGSLHAVGQIRLVHSVQCIAQLRSRLGLLRRHLTRAVAQLPLQLRQVIRKLLPVFRKLIPLLDSRLVLLLIGWRTLTRKITHAISLGMLFFAEPIAFLRERIQTACSLLLLRPAHQVGSIAKLIGRLARGFTALLLACAALHRLLGAAQAIESLGHARIRPATTRILLRRITRSA